MEAKKRYYLNIENMDIINGLGSGDTLFEIVCSQDGTVYEPIASRVSHQPRATWMSKQIQAYRWASKLGFFPYVYNEWEDITTGACTELQGRDS